MILLFLLALKEAIVLLNFSRANDWPPLVYYRRTYITVLMSDDIDARVRQKSDLSHVFALLQSTVG